MRDQFHRSPTLRPAVPTTMTTDKQNNGPPTKPFTPTLSAAFTRSNKNPLTPKLAGAGGYHTPRRLAHADTASPISSKEDISTPAPTFLSANVTPRSGPRNSRRDGTVSPPAITPTGIHYIQQTTRSTPSLPIAGHRTERSPARSPARGSARTDPSRTARAKSITTEGHHQLAASRPSSSCGSSTGSPMFFHANDARSSASYDQDTRPRSYVKTSPTVPFLYASDTKGDESQTDDSGKALSISKRRSTGPARPVITTKPHPVLSPRLRSPQLPDSENRRSVEGHLQSSPQIDDVVESKSPQQPVPSLTSPEQRRSSLVGRRPPHRKTASVDSTHHTTPQREGRRTSPTLSPAFLSAEAGNCISETPELRPRIVSNGSSISLETCASIPLSQSPVKTDGNAQETNDVAASARTERKVLDLEISNSSLLAINRTLERELRKQQAEVRRYRRLSRSGRLSMAASLRSASGTGLSIVSETDDGTSELSSIHSHEELSDSGDDDSSFVDEGTLSPSTIAEHDARHRTRDEKRFFLDLSKHQELLVDSQKMNQSLKRCLGWTEELIKEGKKALEYHVTVSDVELGGRVLAPDELSEVGESTQGLLSPSTEIPPVFSAFD